MCQAACFILTSVADESTLPFSTWAKQTSYLLTLVCRLKMYLAPSLLVSENTTNPLCQRHLSSLQENLGFSAAFCLPNLTHWCTEIQRLLYNLQYKLRFYLETLLCIRCAPCVQTTRAANHTFDRKCLCLQTAHGEN